MKRKDTSLVFLQLSDSVIESSEEVFGQIYYADLKKIEKLPEFEIETIEFFDNLPNNWTYSYAHPVFIDLAAKLMEVPTV